LITAFYRAIRFSSHLNSSNSRPCRSIKRGKREAGRRWEGGRREIGGEKEDSQDTMYCSWRKSSGSYAMLIATMELGYIPLRMGTGDGGKGGVDGITVGLQVGS
jgi:hypothetical protein